MFLTEVKNGANTVVGAKQTLKAIINGRAKIIALADGAADKIKKPVENACAEHDVPCEHIATMAELGKVCGIKVGAATAVILKS